MAIGELVTSALGSDVSLVTAVGNQFIDSYAASLKQLAVELFGTNDKPALVIGIVVVATAISVVLGIVSRRWRPACPSGIAGFGVLGGILLARDPQGDTSTAVVAAVAAAVAGVTAWWLLWSAAATAAGATIGEYDAGNAQVQPITDRRHFLIGAGTTLAVSGGTLFVARRLRARDSVASARRSTVLPRPTRSITVPDPSPDVPVGTTPYVTPTDDFYRIDTALFTPQIDAGSWELEISGMVDTPLRISYADLLELDNVEIPVTIQCVSNEIGGNLVGTALWQGVPLASLLERARIQPGAEQVFTTSTDGFTAGFPLADALDGRQAIVAYAMNGEPLPAEHGYPARLIVAGLYGYVSATKWLQKIELTKWDGVDGYWVPRGWSKLGPIKTASRIDVPRGSIAAGTNAIAGVAWAPDLGIAKVEVQVDGGEWLQCELGPTSSNDTWVQWWLTWDATPGDHELRVRATDKDGNTQTDDQRPPAPDGATGWHTRSITVE